MNLARVYLGRGELDQAASWVGRALRAQPGYPDLHTVRGLVALAEDRTQDALTAFKKATELAPENIEALANLGATLLGLGVHNEARTTLERALRLGPARPETALNLALLWDRREDPARALYLYRQFLDLAPADDPDRERVGARIVILEPRLLKVPGNVPD